MVLSVSVDNSVQFSVIVAGGAARFLHDILERALIRKLSCLKSALKRKLGFIRGFLGERVGSPKIYWFFVVEREERRSAGSSPVVFLVKGFESL